MLEGYISREAALMKLMQDGCSAKNLQSISDMPAADVAEVVHGGWEETGCDTIICSRCGFEYDLICMAIEDYAYCPNCGSKMDGGAE